MKHLLDRVTDALYDTDENCDAPTLARVAVAEVFDWLEREMDAYDVGEPSEYGVGLSDAVQRISRLGEEALA